MRLFFLLIGVGFSFLGSCTTALTVPQLSYLMSQHSHESKNALYYQGSDDKFDYFLSDRHLSDQKVKVLRGELKIDRRFEKSKDRSAWTRLDPYYPHGVHSRVVTPSVINDIQGRNIYSDL